MDKVGRLVLRRKENEGVEIRCACGCKARVTVTKVEGYRLGILVEAPLSMRFDRIDLPKEDEHPRDVDVHVLRMPVRRSDVRQLRRA